MTELEKLVLALSETRFAAGEPLRSQMFEQHNAWLKDNGRFIRRWENVKSRCGTCIRRTQTNLLKHYYDVVWNESSSLEIRVIDSQDGRPVFKKKSASSRVVDSVVPKAIEQNELTSEDKKEVETNGSEANVKDKQRSELVNEENQPPKKESAPKKRRGRPKKSK